MVDAGVAQSPAFMKSIGNPKIVSVEHDLGLFTNVHYYNKEGQHFSPENGLDFSIKRSLPSKGVDIVKAIAGNASATPAQT